MGRYERINESCSVMVLNSCSVCLWHFGWHVHGMWFICSIHVHLLCVVVRLCPRRFLDIIAPELVPMSLPVQPNLQFLVQCIIGLLKFPCWFLPRAYCPSCLQNLLVLETHHHVGYILWTSSQPTVLAGWNMVHRFLLDHHLAVSQYIVLSLEIWKRTWLYQKPRVT